MNQNFPSFASVENLYFKSSQIPIKSNGARLTLKENEEKYNKISDTCSCPFVNWCIKPELQHHVTVDPTGSI